MFGYTLFPLFEIFMPASGKKYPAKNEANILNTVFSFSRFIPNKNMAETDYQ